MEIEELNQWLKESDQKEMIYEKEYWHRAWNQYVEESSNYYNVLPAKEAIVRFISEKNYRERSHLSGCEELGVRIKIGDICFIDFGMSYLNEAGFQHFGILLAFYNSKAFVVPMSSNLSSYRQAGSIYHDSGKKHLLRLGKIKGMNKESVLFLNDAKWINTARIIDVKAHLDKNSELFREIKSRVKKCLD